MAALVGAVAPAGAAPDDKSYTVAVDLDRVCTSDQVTLTFTFANTSGTATQKMRGARVTAPSGYDVVSTGTPVASGGQAWAVSVSGSVVTMVANNAVTGLDEGILPLETVSVAVTLTTPSSAGQSTFATDADQNSDFGGGNEFLLIGSDPVVTAVDCELRLTATPDPVAAGAPVTIDAEVVDTVAPGDGPVESYNGTLYYSVNPATPGCAAPTSGTAAISGGEGSFVLTALSGVGPADLCTVDGTVKALSDSVTFEVEGSAALCHAGQPLCQTGTEFSGEGTISTTVLCIDCTSDTILINDYLEDGCALYVNEECVAIFFVNSTTEILYFADITVVGIPRGQTTISLDKGSGFQVLESCRKVGPPCIYSISGQGDTTTYRIALFTDPPIRIG